MTTASGPTGPDLPRPTPPFEGRIERLIDDAEPRRLHAPGAPDRAPNVVLIMLDDVGFGSPGTFGGPVPMPALDRVAERGLRYNRFHTTALCSPTRAALLTGRNHHTVHMGGITEIANSFPGYDSAIPREAATVAEILRLNGYSTGCFGKWHLTPSWELGPAGPFDRWPTGMGFERFYGILGGEASHWEPAVYDQTTPVQPHLGRQGQYHLSEDLADQAIAWIRRQRVSAPDRPFFCYFAPPAVHTPHHVWPEWIDRFAGRFDAGWDELRTEIHRRQLELGVIPAGTTLTPRPEQIPAWHDYPERYRPVATRLMETFAGFLAHTDAQVGRVLQAVDALGADDAANTLVVYLTGDNGASAEGTIHGAWAAPSFQNGVHEDPEWLLAHIDDFGSARCENHFNVGWAWALDSPFQWMKQVASHFGGTRNGMAVSWPARIDDTGGLRDQFHHVIDLAPTILAAAGVEWPRRVNGIDQLPVQGTAMNYTFPEAGAAAPGTRSTQYFEILGNRAVYHDGWMACCFHGRVPWIRFAGYEFDGDNSDGQGERWELYRVADDFSQSRDLADEHPEKLAELRALFESEAAANSVYPLRDAGSRRGGELSVPRALGGRKRMTYTTDHVRMPEGAVVNLKNASSVVTGRIEIEAEAGSGVIACQGGNMSGWSLYLDPDGRPAYVYNCFGRYITTLVGPDPLGPGAHTLEARYHHDGGFGAGGDAVLVVDGAPVAEGRVERTVPVRFSMSGETFDVGVDTGAPVGDYPHDFPFTGGRVIDVTLERVDEPDAATRSRMADGERMAGLRSQ